MDSKFRSVGLNWIIQEQIEHRLFPVKVRAIGQWRRSKVSHGLFVGREGFVRLERHARIGDCRLGQWRAVLIDLCELGNPLCSGIPKVLIDPAKIQIAWSMPWKVDFSDCFQRYAKNVIQSLP